MRPYMTKEDFILIFYFIEARWFTCSNYYFFDCQDSKNSNSLHINRLNDNIIIKLNSHLYA